MVNKKNIAIIPARGGSKRIPKKNIINFFGKPLIAHTIEAAIKSNIFDRIIVSTDCKEIAEISLQYGAEVPFMREDKADDFSPISDATVYTLKRLEKEFSETYTNVFQLMANCPIRDSSDIIKMSNEFTLNSNTFLISSFKFGWMNPWWAFKNDTNGKPEKLFKEGVNKRSQDLDDLFCPTGSIWIAKGKDLIKEGTYYGKGHSFFELNWKSAMDIDDFDDLEMAKAIYLVKQNKV